MSMNPILSAMPAQTGSTTGTGSTAPPSSQNLTNDTQNMFMQLLTAQLQNQSPLDPVDPTQFTSQLVQFNMLDQLSQINQTLQNAFAPPATASTTSPSSATPSL